MPRLHVRVMAVVLAPFQFLTGNSLAFEGASNDLQTIARKIPGSIQGLTDALTAGASVPNTTPPKTSAPSLQLEFSSPPTDHEITSARVFEEPLIPNGKTTAQENSALAQALLKFSNDKTRAGLSGLETFLITYPQSAWSASVQADLGLFYRNNGYYSRAIAAWEASWNVLKDSPDPLIHPLADRVAAELLTLLSSLGRSERIEPLLKEIKDRPIYGSATEQILAARENLWLMHHRPGNSFKCGPYALDQIRTFTDPATAHDPLILKAASSSKGFSLDQVEALSKQLKMSYQMAIRSPGAKILTPSVVHWKSGHYAAVLKEDHGTYLVKDPTFGRIVNFTPDALDDESDGYFLVPAGPLPAG